MAINDKALAGKVALVTGGSRGIGRGICAALARRGAKVIINYASREEAARECAAEVESAGGQAVISKFDVGNSAQVTETIISSARTSATSTSWSTTPASRSTAC